MTSFEIGLVLLVFIAFFGGILIGSKAKRSEYAGTLVIDTSDPDGPYMFLEATRSVSEIMECEEVILGVSVRKMLPQK